MSGLRDLVDGECGGANSLVGLTSHFIQDRALKEEGLGRFPNPAAEGFSNSDADQLVEQFLGETLGRPPSYAPTFRMDSLLEEMREIEHNAPVPAMGLAALASGGQDHSIWADQYLESGKQFQDFMERDQIWNEGYHAPKPGEVFEFGFGPNWANDYLQASEHDNVALNEADWADGAEKNAAGQGRDKMELQDTANALLESVDDPKFTYSKFMKFMGQIGDGDITIEDGKVVDNDWVQQYKAANPDLSANGSWSDQFLTAEPSSSSGWAEQFEEQTEPPLDEGSAVGVAVAEPVVEKKAVISDGDMAEFIKQWKACSAEEMKDWSLDFDEDYEPFQKYNFAPDNPMEQSADPLSEGKRMLEMGDLPSAVLCFEAAVKLDPDSAESWQLLGTTQAENEQDPAAIPALRKCLSLQPDNLTALMSLAVSYTNESYQIQACQLLKDWIRSNPRYADLVELTMPGEHGEHMIIVSSMVSQDRHEQVRDMYLAAARRSPLGPDMDPAVQCGLGVIYNLSSEFDKAADCFRAALHSMPQDPRMWNRLGATLANGNRSEEAVDAYHHALQLSPGFIRARYNLGITCVNLKAYKEAGEHLLTGLNQQAAGRGMDGSVATWSAMSDGIWTTLRLVISLLERPDLFGAVESRDLKTLNREFGID